MPNNNSENQDQGTTYSPSPAPAPLAPVTPAPSNPAGLVDNSLTSPDAQALYNGGMRNPTEIATAMSNADAFAAETGWSRQLSPQEIASLYAGGRITSTSDFMRAASNAYLTPSQRAQYQNLTVGLSQAAYQKQSQNFQDAALRLTGHDDLGSIPAGTLSRAYSEGWSADHLMQTVMNDPAMQSQFGWLKHGMNYDAFRTYKDTHLDAIRERYGASAAGNDASYLANLDNPLSAFHAQPPRWPMNEAPNPLDNSGMSEADAATSSGGVQQ